MNIKGEIVTVAEALRRVGLEDLATPLEDRRHVEWIGTPRPFACGHTKVYGYGPARADAQPDLVGSHREYQALHRVSQCVCSGPVLFSWSNVFGVDRGDPYRGCGGVVVSIVDLPDSRATALRLGYTA